jgi:TRAP transporter 4TM/12TM fusion protein
MRAAFWGVVSGLGVSFLGARTRPGLKELEGALRGAASGAVQVAAACAAAGVVVGVASLTGIGLRMSELIMAVSQGDLFTALVLTALGSIVLGMGLPTTAAYVVLAALGAPALIQLGVPVLAAHLFIFYFGCISNVTPPVSLAAYAAAGIAGAPPLRTAGTAMLLSLAGFLVPFMFVYGPPLLLDGGAVEILMAVCTGMAGVTALAAAAMGFLSRDLRGWERLFLAGSAGALMFPNLVSDGLGMVVLLLIFLRGRTPTHAMGGLVER